MLKKIACYSLCVLLGCVFLFSGYSKLNPIEPFEFTFLDFGFINWQVAPFLARLMIAVEFLIGALLVLNIQLKKVTYKLGIVVLLFFSIYLALQIVLSGNKGNCGCFGNYFQMTPAQALIKNAIMLLIFLLLNKYHQGWELPIKYNYLIALPYAFALSTPFVLNTIELDYSEAYLNKPEENFSLELDSLYQNAKLTIPPKSLSVGKHVIAFMSLTCPHCRIAAKKMRLIHQRNPSIPLYFVLNGKDEMLKAFYYDTQTDSIPYTLLLGKSFIMLAGTELPAIYLMNNSIVEHQVNYMQLDQKEVENWLIQ